VSCESAELSVCAFCVSPLILWSSESACVMYDDSAAIWSVPPAFCPVSAYMHVSARERERQKAYANVICVCESERERERATDTHTHVLTMLCLFN